MLQSMGSQRARYKGVTEHQEGRQTACGVPVSLCHVCPSTTCLDRLGMQGEECQTGRQETAWDVFSTLNLPVGPWVRRTTDSVVSLLPSTSQGLPSVNFACGQVHTQHTLCVTLDLCLLFVIKKPPNEHIRKYTQQWSLFFPLCELFWPNYFFFFFTKRAANISWGEIRSCFNTVSFNWPWTESTNFLEVTSSSTLDTHSQINELRRFLFR